MTQITQTTDLPGFTLDLAAAATHLVKLHRRGPSAAYDGAVGIFSHLLARDPAEALTAAYAIFALFNPDTLTRDIP